MCPLHETYAWHFQIVQESQDGYESILLQEKAHWIKLWAATVISLNHLLQHQFSETVLTATLMSSLFSDQVNGP